MLKAAHRFIDDNQIREDIPDREGCYRSSTAGSFPFSDRPQGWSVSDCTAEGLKGSLQLRSLVDSPLSPARLQQAAEFILGMQNSDGGWASYEQARGPAWLELLNPSDCFGKIMIDYSYVECTAACVVALRAFQDAYPGSLDDRIVPALEAAREFLLGAQRDDGSFLGCWAVCFTYGTWFGVQGLRALGLPAEHPAIRRAAQFLANKQQTEGGWGETTESNRLGRYVHAESSEPVMTAWALLGLVAAGDAESAAVQRGVDWLVSHQTEAGEFVQGHLTGMFNQTCGIHYDNYPKVFPLWALAEYRAAISKQPRIT
jgi:squalene/oxidosqualene cyclase-like protein